MQQDNKPDNKHFQSLGRTPSGTKEQAKSDEAPATAQQGRQPVTDELKQK